MIDYSYTISAVSDDRVEVTYLRPRYPDHKSAVRIQPGMTETQLRASIEGQVPIDFWERVDVRADGTTANLEALVGQTFLASTP